MIPRIGQQIDMCPSTSGFKSWRSMAYSPQTEAMYIPITLNCELATFGPTEQVLGGAGQDQSAGLIILIRCGRKFR
ncbi:MAG: hypothetical protein CM1200mP40_33410 [Gammaproteobacteria bacterium]|nr:MAG: hypothetical protein CM1200mP40_33410 [Gammaproteobacteria bacterium]